MKQKFKIEGMSCAACVAAVERAVGSLDGMAECSVSLTQGLLLAEYDEAKLSAETIAAAIEKIGYRVANGKATESRGVSLKVRLWASGVLLFVLMYLSMGHMLSLPVPHFLTPHGNPIVFILVQLVLAAVVLAVNRKFFTVGFRALLRRSPNMDTLVATSATAAMVYGLLALGFVIYGVSAGDHALVSRYASNLYIESAAMIVTLVTVGKALEDRSKKKTTAGISALDSLLSKTASVIVDGEEKIIDSADLKLGDTVLIRPGEKLPCDGVIVEGESTLDVSALTGESMPITVTVEDEVMTASINLSGRFMMKATRVGDDTTLAKIIEAVENASASKAPIARLADRVSGIFVPFVMVLSVLTFAFWLFFSGDLDSALNYSISVLVISCPCALGLATPVAITVGVGRLASRGVFVKKAASLEAMASIDTVILDKTGTVTEGRPRLLKVVTADFDETEALTLAASLEAGSEHILSRAILAAAEEQSLALLSVTAFEAIAGRGVYGCVSEKELYLGNFALLYEKNIDTEALRAAYESFSREGKTAIALAVSGKAVALFAIADAIKPTSKEAIASLHREGIHTVLLTGDKKETAEALVAGEGLMIDEVIAEVLPNGKAEVIGRFVSAGERVAMVGDGINDAPALALATVGVAIGSGTDIALENADMVLLKSDLSDLVAAHRIAKKTLVRIKENLFWAFFYNVIAIPIAAGALTPIGIVLSPMIASAAMSLSSLFVVTNSLRRFS